MFIQCLAHVRYCWIHPFVIFQIDVGYNFPVESHSYAAEKKSYGQDNKALSDINEFWHS